MNAKLEIELYRHVVRYLSGSEPLKDFRRWYDSASWEQSVWESDLASSVELALAEYSSGHRTPTELNELLGNAVSHATLNVVGLVFGPPSVEVKGSSQNDLKPLPMFLANSMPLGLVSGKLRAPEYA